MALKENIASWLQEHAGSMGFFHIETEISSRKVISVFVDSMKGITISDCSVISRQLSDDLGTQLNGFSLVVSSAGLDRPLVHRQQFVKNEGKDVTVILKDGHTLKGRLISSSDESIALTIPSAFKKDSPKDITVHFTEIKEVKPVISFK